MTLPLTEPWHLSEVRELLRAAYATDAPLDLYELHQRYLLTPAQVLRAVNMLLEMSVVSVGEKGQSIVLTDHGRTWVLANRRKIFSKSTYWKHLPSEGRPQERKDISVITKGLKLRESDLRFLGIQKRKGQQQ
jgi:hypothetical protein